MTRHRALSQPRYWFVAALFVIGEALIIWTHPQEAKALMRTVYVTLWEYAPKPEGYVPPDRFK